MQKINYLKKCQDSYTKLKHIKCIQSLNFIICISLELMIDQPKTALTNCTNSWESRYDIIVTSQMVTNGHKYHIHNCDIFIYWPLLTVLKKLELMSFHDWQSYLRSPSLINRVIQCMHLLKDCTYFFSRTLIFSLMIQCRLCLR